MELPHSPGHHSPHPSLHPWPVEQRAGGCARSASVMHTHAPSLRPCPPSQSPLTIRLGTYGGSWAACDEQLRDCYCPKGVRRRCQHELHVRTLKNHDGVRSFPAADGAVPRRQAMQNVIITPRGDFLGTWH
ncbi:hypothetical protein MHYP_G00325700 [Metynnis hypsauchen]